ncbi:universal stress protein [soil metagenome]
MSMFPTKVLLAVDGSEEAENAARVGLELSQKTDSELHVIYVAAMPSVLYVPETYHQMEEMADREGRTVLDEQLKKIEEMGGNAAAAYLEIGRPDAEIVRVGEDIGAGLLVVGSRGIGFMRRALLGSVSESTVHHAHCPVLVVWPGENGESSPGSKILVATDDSEEAQMAVDAAVELAVATGDELHLVHAVTIEPPMPYPYPYAREHREGSMESAKKDARQFVEEQAGKIRAETGIVAHVHLRVGRADQEIVTVAEELDAGILVVGSRGLGGVKRALMGSVSDSVVRHAHSPVLVMRK